MSLLIFAVVGIIWMAFPNSQPLHPAASALFTGSEPTEIECSESAPEASSNSPRPTRTAGFSQVGSYVCRRPVFRASERNPLIETVLRAESIKAKRVAAIISSKLTSHDEILSIAFGGDIDPRLQDEIAAVYRSEIVQRLGSGRVAHEVGVLGSMPVERPLLAIELHKVDAPDAISTARLLQRNGSAGDREVEL